MSELVKFFGLSFSALLPLINPLGCALMLMALVGNAPPGVYRKLASRIAINTTLFLLLIQLIGTPLLRFFGISLPVLQVAGGLVLAVMGWKLLDQPASGGEDPATAAPDHAPTFDSLKSKVFYPLTFPLTAGPGSIVVMVTLSAHASGTKVLLPDATAHLGITLAVLALSILVYLCYAYAPAIAARVPADIANGFLRVIAFVLLCIGAQIVWNGVETEINSLMHPPPLTVPAGDAR
jgi:multiple antibiotic resistance protein